MTRWALYEAPPDGLTCLRCPYGATIYGINRAGALQDEQTCGRLALIRYRPHQDSQPFRKAAECIAAEERAAVFLADGVIEP